MDNQYILNLENQLKATEEDRDESKKALGYLLASITKKRIA